MKDITRSLLTYVLGLALGLSIGASTARSVYKVYSNRVIPCQKQVQQGYIAPSNLEIQCKDLDGNGEPETIMKIGDKPYLLREVDGKPVVSEYEIKPVEVIPKK